MKDINKMIYFDTSFMGALFFQEQKSSQAEHVMQTFGDQDLVVSYWTKTEFTSLVARRFRMKELSETFAEKIIHEFEEYISNSFETLLPLANDFSLASDFIRNYETNLRAGDALHLAIAKNRNVNKFYTLDKKLTVASKLIGVPVWGVQ